MTEATMKEKRELIKNTYLAHTHSDEGGRFAKTTQNNVIGSSSVSYPRLPANSPWAAPDPSGQEQPYPVDLSEPPEPVGTAQEIEDSLQPFSWLRSDGVPQAADSLISASPELTPDAEVTHAVTGTAGPSLPASGAGNEIDSPVPAPTNPRQSKIQRRLV